MCVIESYLWSFTNPLHCTQTLNGECSGVELCIVEIPISCEHKQRVTVDEFVG